MLLWIDWLIYYQILVRQFPQTHSCTKIDWLVLYFRLFYFSDRFSDCSFCDKFIGWCASFGWFLCCDGFLIRLWDWLNDWFLQSAMTEWLIGLLDVVSFGHLNVFLLFPTQKLLPRVYRFCDDAGMETAMERWLKTKVKPSQDQQNIRESLWIFIYSYIEVITNCE